MIRHQRGGAASPRQWLVFALLAAGLLSASMNVYQHRHRIQVTIVPAIRCIRDDETIGSQKPYVIDEQSACAAWWNVCTKVI